MALTTIILLSKIIGYLSNLSSIPGILVGFKRKGLLWLYVLSSFLFDINSFILKQLKIPFAWSSNSFLLLEFIILTCYFINITINRQKQRNAYSFVTLAALAFVIHTLYKYEWNAVNYHGASYFYAGYILFSMAGMYKLLNEPMNISIERSPIFVFCVAILIYSSGSFIIILYENELLMTDEKFIKYAWIFIRNPLNIFKNLLIYYMFTLTKSK